VAAGIEVGMAVVVDDVAAAGLQYDGPGEG
jgi:hypothetical protein